MGRRLYQQTFLLMFNPDSYGAQNLPTDILLMFNPDGFGRRFYPQTFLLMFNPDSYGAQTLPTEILVNVQPRQLWGADFTNRDSC
jgi:hypothetical protein